MPVTEHEVEYAIDTQLSASGWLLDPKDSKRNVYKQQARTEEQSKQLGRSRPDYVLYAHEGSNRPTVVIEAKRPGKSLSEALEQGTRYAKKLKAPIVVATDGWRVKTQHVEADSPLLIDEREIEELFGPDLARTFALSHNFSSFSKDVFISQEELIAKFKKANTILKNEGLSAGIERFSEFANLMFLKLQMEGGGGGVRLQAIPGLTSRQRRAPPCSNPSSRCLRSYAKRTGSLSNPRSAIPAGWSG